MSIPSMPQAAVAGVAAAFAGMAAGHLIASFGDGRRSPVLAVGSAVVDGAPTWFKNWAVSTLGSADKPVLLVSVTLVTLLLAAGCGLLARRSLIAGLPALAALGVVAGVCVLTRPGAQWSWLIPTAVTIAVGVGALAWLLSRATTPAVAADAGVYRPSGSTRREFAGGAVGVAVVSGLAVAAGEWIRQPPDIVAGTLPRASVRAPGIPTGLERVDPGITPLRTPNSDFYRVDTTLTVPDVDAHDWSLRIEGNVPHPFTLTYEELLAMPLIERDATLVCVSNEIGGDLAGGATWLGVRTRDLLARAGVTTAGPGAQLLSTSVDGFTVGTPLAALLDDRDALVAIGMNGRLLPRQHGYPARLLTPGLYGMVGATKWLTRMSVTTFGAATGYWQQRGWSQQAPIKPVARIDRPTDGASMTATGLKVGGIAWAPRAGVTQVQVRFDGGPWRPAQLGPEVGVDFWRQWLWRPSPTEPTLSSGDHTVEARVIDADGHAQTPTVMDVYPSGATGYQKVGFTVGQ